MIYPKINFPKTINSAVKLLRDFRLHIHDFPTNEHVIQIFQLIHEIAGVDLMSKSFDRGQEDNNLLLAYYGHILKMCREEGKSVDISFLGFLFFIILLTNHDLNVTGNGLAPNARDFLTDDLLANSLSYPTSLRRFVKLIFKVNLIRNPTI